MPHPPVDRKQNASLVQQQDREADLAAQVALKTAELVKARLEAEKLAASKSEFLACMSHEIRTPLSGILALAQHGLRHCPAPASQALFQQILNAGELLCGMINDMLDFSKIDAGKMPVEAVPVALPAMLNDVISLVQTMAQEKQLQLLLICAPDLPEYGLGDPLRLRQVLLNLLSNAIKFTDQGKVSLQLSYQNGLLQLHVEDTGIGIAPAQIDQIFQPFVQADHTISRRYGGTGLGLSITHRLVGLMHGQIRVSSTLGAGSCFSISLPFPRLAVTSQAEPLAAQTNAPGLAGLSLLVVEDTPVNQLVLQDMLLMEGARVDLVSDGLSAIKKVQQTHYDLVLMDIRMLPMDGVETTRRLLAITPDLPIIGQTADSQAEVRAACLAAGMVDYLDKPVRLEELVRKIRLHCATTRSPAQAIRQSLESRYPGRPVFASTLLNTFVMSNNGLPEQITQALAQQNWQHLTGLLHGLKGMATSIGATDLHRLADMCELALNTNPEDAISSILQLKTQLEQTLAASSTLNWRQQ